MKNITYKILVYILVFTSFSCNEIDLLPVSSKSAEGFYSNKIEVDQALVAAYEALGDVMVRGNYSFWMSESRSDNIWLRLQGYDDGPIVRFAETPTLTALSSCWGAHYKLVFLTNKILETLESVDLNATDKNQFEGEAKFLRGIAYFNLVRYFGDVPLITKVLSISDSYGLSRNSISEVYKQIEEDFKDASALLPDEHTSENAGRATKWSAKGLLGKTYVFQSGYPLKMDKWDAAIKEFKDIIDSGKFAFFENYDDIFQFENELGNQSLFSIRFIAGFGIGNPFPLRMAPGIPYGSTDNYPLISDDLLNSFESEDVRKFSSIEFEWVDRNGDLRTDLPFIKKYNSGPYITSNSDWDIDWIVLRYTDVLLMYAEALNETVGPNTESLSILNNVRSRAGINPRPETSDKEVFRLWIEEERRHEFCFENIRWFDLVRTDRASEVMNDFLSKYNLEGNFTSNDRYLYPIPQRELNLNKNILQNPGY
ncbi:RagB/SusD family nutrient uptake outer membrane protein [Membranihabitans marinus]|uniref:RagB/SusD family nutrient uptake outer membrane protein n=1 Tax=Membranihabitans marinus TaxID=1227546 RepID=UPI001F1826C1|nr:RagB/SusD family nutrient uptake outer membrane protein [Membranihabitans marinus]